VTESSLSDRVRQPWDFADPAPIGDRPFGDDLPVRAVQLSHGGSAAKQ
jgi:hypothetical protein